MGKRKKRVIDTMDVTGDRGGVGIGINLGLVQIVNKSSNTALTQDEMQSLEALYLARLTADCSRLQWLSLMEVSDQNTQKVGLESVYTSLMTTAVADQTDIGKPEEFEADGDVPHLSDHHTRRQLSAIELLNNTDKLVITGEAGSGKSTLIAMLALCMAGELLGNPSNNLASLTEPLPDQHGDPQKDDEDNEQPQPWDHGGLVPLRIILRDFSSSEFFPAANSDADCACLLNFVEHQMDKTGCADYFPVLKGRLQTGQVLVMLDGLDEVSDTGEQRARLIECISGFTRTFASCRYLVTCRPYAYQQNNWQLAGFTASALADFGEGQINRFIRRWYAQMHELNSETQDDRQRKLRSALGARPSLTELAKRPLLLSLIAYLDAHRFSLPEKRAELYAKLFELLVNTWEKARFKVHDAEGAAQLNQQSLAEYLKVDKGAIDHVLERLAFVAHADSNPKDQGTSDIAGKDLINELVNAPGGSAQSAKVSELREYLRDRVGILHQRSGDSEVDAVYAFPHRSFQEFLAARYLRRSDRRLYEHFTDTELTLKKENWEYLAAELGRRQPDRWREVILLCGGIDAWTQPDPIWNLLEQLIEHQDRHTLALHEAWGCRLALEILHESVSLADLKPFQKQLVEELQSLLPALLGQPALPAIERAQAVRFSNTLGDVRPAVCNVDTMMFCKVPHSVFYLGSEISQKNVLAAEGPEGAYDLAYDYFIAKYTVTMAQFRQYWDDVAETTDPPVWDRHDENGPAVDVSWHNAVAFCDWLTQRWREAALLPEGWRVALASEPEWEKAAKGGLAVPERFIEGSISQIGSFLLDDNPMVDNPNPRRQYPWRNLPELDDESPYTMTPDEVVEERVNFQSLLEGPTAPGVLPGGQSPYGCEDLAGNVWEWTRSAAIDYPYPAVGTVEYQQREAADDKAARVLRGGSFSGHPEGVRCSVRNRYGPVCRNLGLGFRCVLSPLL